MLSHSKIFLVLALIGCSADTDGDSSTNSGQDTGTCTPQCPEGENTEIASDIPCDQEDDNDDTVEESCHEVESCGETIYCRATGV